AYRPSSARSARSLVTPGSLPPPPRVRAAYAAARLSGCPAPSGCPVPTSPGSPWTAPPPPIRHEQLDPARDLVAGLPAGLHRRREVGPPGRRPAGPSAAHARGVAPAPGRARLQRAGPGAGLRVGDTRLRHRRP